ncbi:MAG: glycosyltransferase family 39 protein [Thermoanaerobaculia bacterium]|nr:glycosyltransferase family 39 protein [Thermoanaerobaculia bacterium]
MTEKPLFRSYMKTGLAVAAAAAVVYLLAASARDYWSPDEPDFANAVREMQARGSYLVPLQNGIPYSEKPILFYWAMSVGNAVSGFNLTPVFLRLPSVLGSAFLVLGAAFLAGFRGGKKETLLAAAMTASAPLVFWQGQFLQIDAMFSALVLWALICQIMATEDAENLPRWVLAFHVLLSLAILTKGPLALVLTGLFAILRCVIDRSWQPILRLRPLRGILIFLALVLPWYFLAVRAAGKAYAYDLIVRQNFIRFFEAFDHIWPWWFYFESIWGDFSPWTLPAIAGAIYLYRRGLLKARPELAYCVQIFAVVFLFLSTSDSKQGKYLLMVFPLAAVVAAAAVALADEEKGRFMTFLRTYALVLAVLFATAAFLVPKLAAARYPSYARLGPYVTVPFLAGAIAIAAAWIWKRRESTPALLAVALTLGVSEGIVGRVVFSAMDEAKTGRPFYERLKESHGKDKPLAYYGKTYRCYPILILERRTAHVWTETDLKNWLLQTPGGAVLADESESRNWQDPYLKRLRILDRQPVGGDIAQLLAP